MVSVTRQSGVACPTPSLNTRRYSACPANPVGKAADARLKQRIAGHGAVAHGNQRCSQPRRHAVHDAAVVLVGLVAVQLCLTGNRHAEPDVQSRNDRAADRAVAIRCESATDQQQTVVCPTSAETPGIDITSRPMSVTLMIASRTINPRRLIIRPSGLRRLRTASHCGCGFHP